MWSNLKFEYLSYTDVSTETFRFTADSLLNGLTYKIVEISHDEGQQIWSYYGLIREDSAKRVYFRLHNTVTDRLFYDFNLELNDTITVYTVHSQNNSEWVQPAFYNVQMVDSMLIGTHFRKRIGLCDTSHYVPPEYWEHWIDSTGNLGGLFHNYDFTVGSDGNVLLCFTEDGDLKYINPEYTSCFVLTASKALEAYADYVDILPNPVIGISKISIDPAKQHSLLHILFFDYSGNKISGGILDNNFIINHKDFIPGLYFYQILENNQIIQTGKVIIN